MLVNRGMQLLPRCTWLSYNILIICVVSTSWYKFLTRFFRALLVTLNLVAIVGLGWIQKEELVDISILITTPVGLFQIIILPDH